MTDEYEVYHHTSIVAEPVIKVAPPGFTIFSFRAETPVDVVSFLSATYQRCVEDGKRVGNLSIISDKVFPDCEVEFTSDYSLEELRKFLALVDDGHTMVQTLRPLPISENSMARDYNI